MARLTATRYPNPSTVENESGTAPELPRNDLERVIAEAWKDALGVDRVGLNENFFDLGAHSLMVADVHIQLKQLLGREFSLVDLFQFPTVTALAKHLNGEESRNTSLEQSRAAVGRATATGTMNIMNMKNTAIAIVGMAGRFPGARNVTEFWQNLKNGVEAIRPFTDAELLAAGVSAEELAQPEYVKSGVVLDDLEMFDAAFFGFSPKDASIMDPQHRIFLECAWEALGRCGSRARGVLRVRSEFMLARA